MDGDQLISDRGVEDEMCEDFRVTVVVVEASSVGCRESCRFYTTRDGEILLFVVRTSTTTYHRLARDPRTRGARLLGELTLPCHHHGILTGHSRAVPRPRRRGALMRGVAIILWPSYHII